MKGLSLSEFSKLHKLVEYEVCYDEKDKCKLYSQDELRKMIGGGGSAYYLFKKFLLFDIFQQEESMYCINNSKLIRYIKDYRKSDITFMLLKKVKKIESQRPIF